MALSKQDIAKLKNHIPTVKRNCFVFIDVLDTKPSEEEDKIEYLIDLINVMESNLAESKAILETQLIP